MSHETRSALIASAAIVLLSIPIWLFGFSNLRELMPRLERYRAAICAQVGGSFYLIGSRGRTHSCVTSDGRLFLFEAVEREALSHLGKETGV